jgi:Fungal specific transcription factor domain/Fungal Zn(2)-Cys(6) binuclear cluster domain
LQSYSSSVVRFHISHATCRAFSKIYAEVKTGCLTCRAVLFSRHPSRLIKRRRIRRIKCDEQRPACQICFSTGCRCDSYDHYSLDRPFTQSSGDIEEGRLFHFFGTFTLNQFSGDFESSFWSRIVLQACHANSSLRHVVIALASLHEDSMMGQGMEDSQQSIRDNSSFVLRRNTKALEGAKMSLNDKNQSIVLTLMSCVLFFCFESLRGQWVSAVIHLRSGLDILRLSSLHLEQSASAREANE